MSDSLKSLIQRFRSYRNHQLLQSSYNAQYAFVGVGSHAMQNLYPVLQYLGIKLKYICCRNSDKIPLIEGRFEVTATTSLDTILSDEDVKGVFVCTSPSAHFNICSRIIDAGKYAFVEKPPCTSLAQLNTLIAVDTRNKVMVGMQKRYSPYIMQLKSRMAKCKPISYNLIYHTGAYPEGNADTELFIHPIDTALFLFGDAEISGFQRLDKSGATTIQILLNHGNVKGFIELSTAYSWSNPEESLHINTDCGEFRLEQMERLRYYPHPKKFAGIPIDKIGAYNPEIQILAQRNNFSPLVVNNQLYSQGFLSEITAFANMVERSGKNLSPLASLLPTYHLLTNLTTD
ncbi:MAG: Gfo/Idh/MocA family oxidoreductase [Muribaculaceae bacterium]|nr:Gfo/Idh/MocA family oxidoreductase [Muribaculaceae bacterium]